MHDLNALLGSRICHDLISPIGAISNGVELLSLAGLPPGPEIAMIATSVEHANARIRYYRLAFGSASEGTRIARAEVEGILADVSKTGRIGMTWTSDSDLPRRTAKLALLLILCAETALPRGGAIRVEQSGDDWTVIAAGARLRRDDALWGLLTGADGDLDAATVHFALAGDTARAAGRSIDVTWAETEVAITF